MGIPSPAPNDEADEQERLPSIALPPSGGLSSAVTIRRLELLEREGTWLCRASGDGGAEGLSLASGRVADVLGIMTRRVMPAFIGRDARLLPELLDRVYRHESNYKLAGMPFWACVASVEAAALDLLGRCAGEPVGALLGGVRRRSVPVYLSSLRRDTTPEQEVDLLCRRVGETGARGVKIKIGGRMSRNADAAPGRTRRLVELARRALPDGVAIGADANGSYDPEEAVRVGRFLEQQGIAFFEEPCPWEEFEQTRRVADALSIPVSGGEQDTSFPRFRWMIRNRAVDIVQPDVLYNGGLLRTLRVARLAAGHGIAVMPHCPLPPPSPIFLLHLVSLAGMPAALHEYRIDAPLRAPGWCRPDMRLVDGAIDVPQGMGLGLEIDPAFVAGAALVHACAVGDA